ncbi:YjfB family protein [Herminiimonas sp. NPDC097707]|uniref:YjfB family protein n=1 Tax=Herminiimonas sp. NPDC097707 TaxID=3364007 RepID=UPI00383BCCC7
MDVSNIASLATSMAQQRNDVDVSLTVFKKALDMQGSSALALIESVAQTPAALPAHLGNHINTKA